MFDFVELSWLDEMALPAKKYKLYKSSINKKFTFCAEKSEIYVPDRASSKGRAIRQVEILSNKLLTTAFVR